MDLYSIVGSAKPEVTFASDVHMSSFAGGPHVDSRGNAGNGNGQHYISTRPQLQSQPPLPPPPPATAGGKTSIINIILGVTSCKSKNVENFCRGSRWELLLVKFQENLC
jgi:hypothetical protein